MEGHHYLHRRSSAWVFRRPAPYGVRSTFGTSEVRITLETASHQGPARLGVL
ncbi:DUF6538 domain-containing protein [Porphyrobacter sp. MBR-155]|uniref:DUF6538 domain-containing protein n=1 Tax=Porphyrobacter sp. MBR-155 TaxID=3156464 RepID=UPI00339798D4